MAAVAALRCNPDMAAKYAELRARGKPAKVALTAIMRKMVVLANALLKQNRTRGSANRPRAASDGRLDNPGPERQPQIPKTVPAGGGSTPKPTACQHGYSFWRWTTLRVWPKMKLSGISHLGLALA